MYVPVIRCGEKVFCCDEGVQSILVLFAGGRRGRSEMPREVRSRGSEGRLEGGIDGRGEDCCGIVRWKV